MNEAWLDSMRLSIQEVQRSFEEFGRAVQESLTIGIRPSHEWIEFLLTSAERRAIDRSLLFSLRFPKYKNVHVQLDRDRQRLVRVHAHSSCCLARRYRRHHPPTR